MAKIIIDTETSDINGNSKPLISIADLPRVMAEHRLKMGYHDDLLVHTMRIMAVAPIRDMFYKHMTKENK